MIATVVAFKPRNIHLAYVCALSTALALLLLLATPYIEAFGFVQRREMQFRNFLVVHGHKNPPDPRLVYLGIDETSVNIEELDFTTLFADVPRESTDFHALTLIAKQWPWPREIYGLLLDKLFAAGARVVVFDLLFPKPSVNPRDDALFRTALDRYGDRVVVGSNFERQALAGGTSELRSLPADTLIPQTDPPDPRTAFVNFWPDVEDEKVRRTLFRRTFDGAEQLSLAASAVSRAGLASLVPPAADRDWIFRYTAPPGLGFPPRSVYQVFVPKYWEKNFAGGEALRDKIVIIGPAGNWQHDEHATPFGKMPGPELHLNAVNALLHQAFISEAPGWADALLVCLAGATVWAIALLTPRPVLQFARLLLGNGAAVCGALAAYNFLHLYTATVVPLIAFNVSGIACFLYEFGVERREKSRTRRTLERYVSKDVVHELLDNRQSVLAVLGGTRRPITVLFSDLRGFTSLTESAEAAGLVTQLNEYFQRMVRIVFANGGTLDKFIGDGLMAHWGSIVTDGERADACHAVRTALQMRVALAELNAAWRERGWPVLDFGIGINSGDAIVGNLGCEEKMEVSVIGDPVNLASRIEGATKEYHVDLLIGGPVAELLGETFLLRTVDQLRVKGKTRPIEVLTVLGEQSEETAPPEWLVLFELGVRLYRQRQFARAVDLFLEAMQLCPQDWMIEEYLRRAQVYAIQPPSPDWTGVHVLGQK